MRSAATRRSPRRAAPHAHRSSRRASAGALSDLARGAAQAVAIPAQRARCRCCRRPRRPSAAPRRLPPRRRRAASRYSRRVETTHALGLQRLRGGQRVASAGPSKLGLRGFARDAARVAFARISASRLRAWAWQVEPAVVRRASCRRRPEITQPIEAGGEVGDRDMFASMGVPVSQTDRSLRGIVDRLGVQRRMRHVAEVQRCATPTSPACWRICTDFRRR